MKNIPTVKMGIIAVSRDCFPIELSRKRRQNVIKHCKEKTIPIAELDTIIENEKDVLKALEEVESNGINSLVIFLGNFGPEGPTTLLAQKFDGPIMICAAGEESQEDLIGGRGDAYCGMLNASYNLNLRNISNRVYIPEYPVGLPSEIADMIIGFIPVARIILGLKKLKIFSFGPRPQDFLACNAPIKPLYDMGIEIMENSELDLYDIYLKAENDPQVEIVVKEMAEELGEGNVYPDLLKKLAQYEVALMKFYEENLGASEFGIFANKCWPSFEQYFKFVPCYVNSRLASKGIPISCEVDIYGVLSEYIATLATQMPATLLDINNTVPPDMFKANKDKMREYTQRDLFMGFHCGNTPTCYLSDYSMKHQVIMHRLMEPESEPNITRGTLEGTIKPSKMTLFRIQATPDTQLRAYIAEGEILDINPKSFGGIGVFAVPEMGRFYRHVLIGKHFPHHVGIAFDHAGKSMFTALKMLGVKDISVNLPKGTRYYKENPFE